MIMKINKGNNHFKALVNDKISLNDLYKKGKTTSMFQVWKGRFSLSVDDHLFTGYTGWCPV